MIKERLFAAVAAVMMAIGSLAIIASPAESEAYNLILSEGFDGSWDPGWNVTDHNTDSGDDYWGLSSHKKLVGTGSAWCAQIGSNSVNDQPNSDNHYYDQDMQAVMQITLPDASGYESVTLGFYYWAETGTIALNDYLEVRVWNGWFWQHLWKQPEVDTGGSWDLVVLDIPLNSVWLSFSFVSDDSVGSGPYEGVYVDGVTVYGLDDTPPTSSIVNLDDYYSSEMVYIIYTAVDRGGSGVEHVELYYRKHGSANYEMYTTPDNPNGTWTEGMIPFNCSLADGFGGYDFYTLAEDITANREVPIVDPQTSTMFDIAAPSTEALVVGGSLPNGWINGSISIELSASDDLSGIAVTWCCVNSSTWEEYEGAIDITSEGEHTIAFYSEDNAGNKEGVKAVGFAIDTALPIAGLSPLEDTTTFVEPTVEFLWESTDELSGIDYCLFRIDDRAFEFLGESNGMIEAVHLENGEHTATLRAYDCAGNYVEVSYDFSVDLGAEAGTEIDIELLGWIAAIAVLLTAIAALVLLVQSHRKRPS